VSSDSVNLGSNPSPPATIIPQNKAISSVDISDTAEQKDNAGAQKRAQPRFIYFARCEGFVKIGVARDVANRMTVLATACPFEIEYLGCMPGDVREESILHDILRPHYHRNEWFREEGLVSELVAIMSESGHFPPVARVLVTNWYAEKRPERPLLGPVFKIPPRDLQRIKML
jgi:hypothetical protein